MTDTGPDLARLAALVERYEHANAQRAALLDGDPTAEPFAAPVNFPPSRVAAGTLVESAWGNDVVDGIDQLRSHVTVPYNLATAAQTAPGSFDLYTSPADTANYPRHMTVWVNMQFGFSGSGPSSAAVAVYRFSDGFNFATQAHGAMTSNYSTVPVALSWDVAPGVNAAFKVTANISYVSGSCWHGGHGLYLRQRT